MADQLATQEVDATSAVLLAGARHYGQYCKEQNDTFMACRFAGKDPEKCVEEGKKVTACALQFFKLLRQNCNTEFTKHWECLEYNNQESSRCRDTQLPFDVCMWTKLKLDGDYRRILGSE
eukprot:comp19863_c0_seq1/m.23994 comp19863_c0_seq1/g.23994  ORF comp19863_c0_seq1/g.23994 comp19863_c0_seq1/m.23994 type:complete len:120 (-) comp19863_c0_seq1:145-504(-)